jgi:metallo-beta-lactamase family protein
MNIKFCGAARTVTGSNFLLEVNNKKYIIECGLTQGNRFVEDQNYQPLLYNAKEIEAVFVTHAHIDHIGLLPRLVNEGFTGKIYSTAPTADLVIPMLEDAYHILRREAEENGKPMIYQERDLRDCFDLFEGTEYGVETKVNNDIKVRFRDAGHVLGSAIIEIWAKEDTKERKIVFSGDLGNPPTPLLMPTEVVRDADYVLIESTYGDRTHEDKNLRKGLLKAAIEETIKAGGVLMVPAFALERTQELLFELNELVENKKIPAIPIFIDSPLAIRLTDIYKKYQRYYNKKAKYLISEGDQIFDFPGLRFTERTPESKKINDIPPPKVIIAGSGMSNGGRILHHERRYLPDPKNLLLIIAYQSAGSLGRRLFQGDKVVRMFGGQVQVRCKVKAIGGYSAHADKDGLVRWLSEFDTKKIRKVFVVHGEEKAALSLVDEIKEKLSVDAIAPSRGDEEELV